MKLENEIDKEVTEELKKVSKIQNLEKENQELQKMTKKIYEENEDLKAKLRSKIKQNMENVHNQTSAQNSARQTGIFQN